MGKTITITVDKGSDVTIEANGFAGETCLAATRPFEEAVGEAVVSRRMKPEATAAAGAAAETGQQVTGH